MYATDRSTKQYLNSLATFSFQPWREMAISRFTSPKVEVEPAQMGYAVATAAFLPWLWEHVHTQPLAQFCITLRGVEPTGGVLCRAC